MSERVAVGWLDTPAGRVPRVGARLTWRDRLGTILVRSAIGRMRYAVLSGLYALGNPGPDSHVFVSANYKLSFDHLRQRLDGLDAWILVLDTKGINVWCAAGKGTFGTAEIVRRIAAAALGRVVAHRRIILPQLGAPGVSAHEVRKRSGFEVIYGPVRARDIKSFLAAGLEATPEMRRVKFGILDRAVLIPVEFVMGAKMAMIAAAFLVILAGLGPGVYSIERAAAAGPAAGALFLGVFLAAVVLAPLLLPALPGRSFSAKGAWLGAALAAGYAACAWGNPGASRLECVAWILAIPAVVSFVTMNFTGASTYTSLSGVQREMRVAVPAQIAFVLAGAGLWVAARFT